ncbi:MAG: MBL fold metallo-hydrolase [Alphaproteobacteria bacterium]|nr:MBL fold metallo-hydrolase [Alphaproteobacteria bacterium]
MKLSFHGADRDVTGSCHLLEVRNRRILIDCGLFQGSQELAQQNAGDFGFDPSTIDLVLLTHAHLDHCGRLPLLSKRGFRGQVITTAATRELTRLVLLDSAHLQEEEARTQSRHGRRRGEDHPPAPLYSIPDTLNLLDRFGATAEYGAPLQLADDIRATFVNAGHILGSASILIEAGHGSEARRILFSGDIGNTGQPLLASPTPPANADIVVMETTYGDRNHRPFDQSITEFLDAVSATLARGGNVVIPTFALDRAQEILFILRQGIDRSQLPPGVQVFLDSPMAIAATEIFARHAECLNPAVSARFADGGDPLKLPNLHLTRESADSIAINRISGGAVIMAGSGMCTGGRIRHHLRHNLGRKESAIVFVGFAASGTPARSIIDGAKHLRLLGEDIPVRASIHTINGFSAHADQSELTAWHSRIGGCRRTFLVHGEEETMKAFAGQLKGQTVAMPGIGDQFDLS